VKTQNVLGKSIGLFLITAGALIILAFYYVTAGGRLPFAGHLYTVTAQIQDTQGLLKHADVRAAGVKVGSVSNINNTTIGGQTVANVQLQLNSNFAPIYNNATVLIRQKTLVGENYVEVNRGTAGSGELADGGTLPLAHDLEAVPVDDILNALTPPVRIKIRQDLAALGNGLHNEGQHLNQFLGGLAPVINNGGVVFDVLNNQKAQVADAVSQTANVMQALAARQADIQTLIHAANVTATAVAARDTEIAQVFAQLPPTLQQARTSVGILTGFAGTATPVIANLKNAVANLQPVFADLKPTALAARRLFDAIPPFLRKANPLLTNLTKFSAAADPAVMPLDAFLRQADPVIAYLAPYNREIGSTLMNFGNSMYKDATGDYIGSCQCPVSIESYDSWTPAEQQLVSALIKAGGLGGIANPTYNPLRQPGTLPNTSTPNTLPHPTIQPDPPAALKDR
jgi:phospholipid/cholesterol/gamma-HCH transport system substrate-binding protein